MCDGHSKSTPITKDAMQPLKLVVKGFAIPSFKNSKMLTQGRIITKPEYQEIMERITQSFVSQLRSYSATIGDATAMDASQLCLTALLEHSKEFDDSRQWLPEENVKAIVCDKGNEGAIIEITVI